MSLMWCGSFGPNDDRENGPVGPPLHEPEPDDSDPDDETDELVRPVKT